MDTLEEEDSDDDKIV